jgi:hypothetical protein
LFKRTLISIGGGAFITVVALYLATWRLPVPTTIAKAMLWPLATFMFFFTHLIGQGPPIGPPESHMHEWTPIHFLAYLVGIVGSWMFYSWLIFFVLEIRVRRTAMEPSSPERTE